MPKNKTNGSIDKLKGFRRRYAERYAKALMDPPRKTTMARAIPPEGVIVIMGDRREGKSGLAYKIAEDLHRRRNMPAVVHMPSTLPENVSKKLRRLFPKWLKIVTRTQDWPLGGIVIYDEASQTLHARRTQTVHAVTIDNLIGISGQRHQLIIFIAHYGKKLDFATIAEANLVIWKRPTWAHALFERDELSDFTYKALNFYEGVTCVAGKRACLVMNFRHMEFTTFNNSLPSFWSDDLSCIFQGIEAVTGRG